MSWQCLLPAEHSPRHCRGLKDEFKETQQPDEQTANYTVRENEGSAALGGKDNCCGSKGVMQF